MAAVGVTLATAAGWSAEPLVVSSYGGEGLRFAEQVDADLAIVGSRGLGGARAVLGSVSDMVVHYTHRHVLVVPHPLLIDEFAALATGAVLVGYDGSAGARAALATAGRLFPDRTLLAATVQDGEATDETTGPLPVGDRERHQGAGGARSGDEGRLPLFTQAGHRAGPNARPVLRARGDVHVTQVTSFGDPPGASRSTI
ncbi:universal stress protein [Dactylosporangium sp. NPDC050588]|uniref:universal stress protein n=1 Tax=Dactylosporangium sp. NPDC050588 TaxID=3157211 RepID=UPI0033FEF832